jgi:3,4-dihydroxy 2-butanone 4-phosphate synthase/GTP cyclohydrolase II
MFNTIEEALLAFKNGNPILVVDDESRENEGDIIFPADAATQEKLNLCASQAKGLDTSPVFAGQVRLHAAQH